MCLSSSCHGSAMSLFFHYHIQKKKSRCTITEGLSRCKHVNDFVVNIKQWSVTSSFLKLLKIENTTDVKRNWVVCHLLCCYSKSTVACVLSSCDSILSLLVQRPARKSQNIIAVTYWPMQSSLVLAVHGLLCLNRWIKRFIQKSIPLCFTFKATVHPFHH